MSESIKHCEECGSTKLKWFYDDKFQQWYQQCENCGEQYESARKDEPKENL